MRRSPNARRAMATTSCEVMPAGLSTSSSPSVERLLIGGDSPITDLLEERLDSRGAGDAGVGVKGKLWSEAKTQGAPKARAQVCGGALQPFERGLLLDV